MDERLHVFRYEELFESIRGFFIPKSDFSIQLYDLIFRKLVIYWELVSIDSTRTLKATSPFSDFLVTWEGFQKACILQDKQFDVSVLKLRNYLHLGFTTLELQSPGQTNEDGGSLPDLIDSRFCICEDNKADDNVTNRNAFGPRKCSNCMKFATKCNGFKMSPDQIKEKYEGYFRKLQEEESLETI